MELAVLIVAVLALLISLPGGVNEAVSWFKKNLKIRPRLCEC